MAVKFWKIRTSRSIQKSNQVENCIQNLIFFCLLVFSSTSAFYTVMMNGICHLEGATGGGGNGTSTNWHMNLLPSSNEKTPAPNVTPSSNPTVTGYHQPPPKQPALEFNHHHPTAQHHQQQANGGGGAHQTAAAAVAAAAAAQSLLESTQQQQQQHLPSISAHPVPPPSLRESVIMGKYRSIVKSNWGMQLLSRVYQSGSKFTLSDQSLQSSANLTPAVLKLTELRREAFAAIQELLGSVEG
ncbi:hypothetical protein ACTXT7_001790 [Hymenolepis weldensis]